MELSQKKVNPTRSAGAFTLQPTTLHANPLLYRSAHYFEACLYNSNVITTVGMNVGGEVGRKRRYCALRELVQSRSRSVTSKAAIHANVNSDWESEPFRGKRNGILKEGWKTAERPLACFWPRGCGPSGETITRRKTTRV